MGSGGMEGRRVGYTASLELGLVNRRRGHCGTAPIQRIRKSRSGHRARSFVSTPFHHGRDDDGESKWGIEQIPVVTRYLLRVCIYPLVSPLFLRVGRIRRQVGTYRFHRPTPVRHPRTSPVCSSSIVCILAKNGLIYANWSSTKSRKCASPSFSAMSSAHSRSAPRTLRCSWKIQSIRPQNNPHPL